MQKLKAFLESTVIKYLRQAGVAAFIVIGLYFAFTWRVEDRNATIQDDKKRLEKCEAENIKKNNIIATKDSIILAGEIAAKKVLESIILTYKK